MPREWAALPVSEIVTKIQKTSIRTLTGMISEVLEGAQKLITDQVGVMHFNTVSEDIQMRFVTHMNNNFDELLDKEIVKDNAVFSFENLSLVQEEELEVMVALEGMVNAARNEHLPVFISFNTRLASLFPGKRIDESTNPLDPDQVATAFQEALRPVGLNADNNLAVYRSFNKGVLKNLDKVLNEANGVLIESHVIPDLGMEAPGKKAAPARTTPRPKGDSISSFGEVEEETFADDEEEQPELFSIMQNLLHFDEPENKSPQGDGGAGPAGGSPIGGAPAGTPMPAGGGGLLDDNLVEALDADGNQVEMVPMQPGQQQYMIPAGMIPAGMMPADSASTGAGGAQSGVMQPFMPAEGQQVQMVDQAKLMEVLTAIQETLSQQQLARPIPGTIDDVEKLDISASLGEVLQSQANEGIVSAVDRQSSDIINLVTLLYEAIWDDISVPIPIKELIGRTQITIIKVALADVEFFNNENHPARAILNEFASAGIGWTEVEQLEEDPLYKKIQEMVERILIDYEDDMELFEDLLQDFRAFRAKEAAKTRFLEKRILKAKERQDRLDDIHELCTQKIEERVLGRDLHPFVEELLKEPFHKFMVMLVLKEGPGSNAWKQAINTIDVLLWSVQPHEQAGDRERLETINPRLFNNLRKAFRIASVDAEEIDELMAQLKRVQDETFHGLSEEEIEAAEAAKQEPVEAEAADTGETAEDEAETTAETAEEEDAAEEEGFKPRFLAAGEDEAEETEEEPAPEAVEEDDNVVPMLDSEPEAAEIDISASVDEEPVTAAEQAEEAPAEAEEEMSDDDPHMKQVESLNVGMWVEFAGESDSNTRCKLAAKINAIDKYIFVNRQGVKVVEKTKKGLATELRDGTVSIISDGLLFSRALESVIGNLRESQHEQQTGSAYNPGQTA